MECPRRSGSCEKERERQPPHTTPATATEAYVGGRHDYGRNYAPHYLPAMPPGWEAAPPASASPYFANASSALQLG